MTEFAAIGYSAVVRITLRSIRATLLGNIENRLFMDFDDLMRSTNGSAYEAKEVRNGPPLEYVGEKLRSSLEQLHSLVNNIEACVPQNLPLPPSYREGAPISAKDDLLKSPAYLSFYYQIVAFVALNNMLGSVSSGDDVQRLTEMSREEFGKWLDVIEREGSVTGLS